MPPTPPFWKTKTLEQMTHEEWESLCDGCGRCCLHKLRDEDTELLRFTDVACRLLDTHSCQCSDYVKRRRREAYLERKKMKAQTAAAMKSAPKPKAKKQAVAAE